MLSIDKKVLLDYKRYLTLNHRAANTVNSYTVAIRALYKFLEERGISANHAKNLKGVKASKSFSKSSLTIDQLIEVLNSFDKSTLEGKRNYALISLMVNTVLRVMDAQSSDVEDIDQTSGQAILYIQGKGRDIKDNYFVLEHNVLEAINEYLICRGEQEGTFFKGTSNGLW